MTEIVTLKLWVDIDVLQWFAKQVDYREHMSKVLRQHVDEMHEIEAAVAGPPIVTRAKPLLEEIGKLWLLLTPAERQRFRQNDGWVRQRHEEASYDEDAQQPR